MPAKIGKEVRQRIYDLNKESKSVKEILGILKSEGIKISDKSIYKILKEKTNNQSFFLWDIQWIIWIGEYPTNVNEGWRDYWRRGDSHSEWE